ncbi:MAG: uracil-DNA glycosylase [Spirochaetia bacterium]
MNNNHTDYPGFIDFLHLIEDYLTSGFKTEPVVLQAEEAGEQLQEGKPEQTSTQLESLHNEICACTKCDLHFNRLHAVPGEGVGNPLLLVIGEAPGGQEDKKGLPFVGRAGQYLDKWLQAIQIDRTTNCFITNVVKCRPPENRDPHPEEIRMCLPYLEQQIQLLKPAFLLSVGRISSQLLVESTKGIGALRGGTYFYRNLPLVPTFHPSAVLRDQSLRAKVWEDLKLLRTLMRR